MPHKRYLRIDIEYDMDINPIRLHSFVILDNIKRIIAEDMPYIKIIFTRDSFSWAALNKCNLDHEKLINELFSKGMGNGVCPNCGQELKLQ